MTIYTEAEVEAAIEEADLYWGELDWELNRSSYAPGGLTLRGDLVPVTVLDSETGHEGDWDRQTYVVFKIGNQTFRKTGHYQSHVGDDWSGPLKEVISAERTVTVFVNREDAVSTYTAREVESAIESAKDYDDWGQAQQWRRKGTHQDWRGHNVEHEDTRLMLDIKGTLEYAEYVDGKQPEEGGGERIFIVFKVGSQFFRKSGYYLSHDGAYWDGSVDEVTPVEKTVTVYEAS